MSNISEIQHFTENALRTFLDNICSDKKRGGFEKNELAYLSAQGKNELQIRDKIAWQLHKEITNKYGNQYMVRREWAPKGNGRKKVDLAILEMDDSLTSVVRIIALIEFKAQSIVKQEQWYIEEFKNDVNKMRGIAQKDTDLYFVFLETGQDKKADKYKSILGFAVYQTKSVSYYQDQNSQKYLSAIKGYWNEFQKAIKVPIKIPQPKAIYIGEAYGYKQYISPLVIGPFRKSSL